MALAMTNAHVLPDSRLKDGNLESMMVDWELVDGTTVRIEVVPVFCANCGKKYGHVPKDNTGFAFWLCRRCHETHGEIANTMAVPDDEWCRAVQHEMEERFGHALDAQEIAVAVDRDQLGPLLKKLAAESPFPVPAANEI